MQRYHSLFCSFLWPRHPGRSGGEIRDFHLLRHLLSLSEVSAFALVAEEADRPDSLFPRVRSLFVPGQLPGTPPGLQKSVRVRRLGLPFPGPAVHTDVADKLGPVGALVPHLQDALDRYDPDFLFVSPQVNPVATLLDTGRTTARLILASYDVEAVRIRRLAESESGLRGWIMRGEARLARRFERANLARFDGVIAVSEVDRRSFVDRYGIAPERVLVIENGVDPEYFAFHARTPSEVPEIVFVGALGYLPNGQAAERLLESIMPLVRRSHPEARLLLVGQGPSASLLARDDGQKTVVTGAVDDVRPYLARAAVACLPLKSGSGTKYKLLEALSAGVPVACSPLATEGLAVRHDRHVLEGRTDEEIAAAVVRLIDDPDLARRLAEEGRRLIETRYAWDANLPRLDSWLERIVRLPRLRFGTPR